MPRQTTFRKNPEIKRSWHHVDAAGRPLGRLAAQIAPILMGKHRPDFTPHVDCGDYVVVTNAAKVVLTGNKAANRTKARYSGYPGGIKYRTFQWELDHHADRLVEEAVRRMLPKSRLGVDMLAKLKVYVDDKHPHASNNLQEITA
jgi:large subunit ribosomal protein L13